jgi:hypothetical protein
MSLDACASRKDARLRVCLAACSRVVTSIVYHAVGEAAYWDERRAVCGVLRCVFGNPFRPLALPGEATRPTVETLAQAAYDERELPTGHLDPVRLALLADALEEAGADQAILEHLRSPGPHVRGCHVVDLLLGKG